MSPHITRREFLEQFLLSAGGLALGGTLNGCNPLSDDKGTVPITLLHINDLHGALQAKATKNAS